MVKHILIACACIFTLIGCGSLAPELQALQNKAVAKHECNEDKVTMTYIEGTKGKKGAVYLVKCDGKTFNYRYVGNNAWRIFIEGKDGEYNRAVDNRN